MSPPVVTLSPLEVAWGWDLAKMRAVSSLVRQDTNQAGAAVPGAERLAIHLHGALAEVALAQYLGLTPPLTVNTFHGAPDLPPDIEVRWVRKDEWDLTIRPGDPARRRYCLVTGSAPTYVLRGWLWREEVRPEWWKDYGGYGHPAWSVPQAHLHPMPTRAEQIA